jgi:hypothetical protein
MNVLPTLKQQSRITSIDIVNEAKRQENLLPFNANHKDMSALQMLRKLESVFKAPALSARQHLSPLVTPE